MILNKSGSHQAAGNGKPMVEKHEFYFLPSSLSKDNLRMLKEHGYRYLHRPYFAMRGNDTHQVHTLIPCNRCVIDAGPADAKLSVWEEMSEELFKNTDCIPFKMIKKK